MLGQVTALAASFFRFPAEELSCLLKFGVDGPDGFVVGFTGAYVKGIVHRPSVHGVMVYGQPHDRITCMAEVISHTRYQIYETVETLLHVLEVRLHSHCTSPTPETKYTKL